MEDLENIEKQNIKLKGKITYKVLYRAKKASIRDIAYINGLKSLSLEIMENLISLIRNILLFILSPIIIPVYKYIYPVCFSFKEWIRLHRGNEEKLTKEQIFYLNRNLGKFFDKDDNKNEKGTE